MNTSKLLTPWYWLLLKIAVLGIFAFLVYFEIITAMVVFDKPEVSNTVTNEYCEGCGLFGPVLYMFTAGVTFLGKLGPILEWIITVAFIINSVVLFVWLFVVRASFKHQKWAAIFITILSAASLLLAIPSAIDQQQYLMILPSVLMFCLALKCSLAEPKTIQETRY